MHSKFAILRGDHDFDLFHHHQVLSIFAAWPANQTELLHNILSFLEIMDLSCKLVGSGYTFETLLRILVSDEYYGERLRDCLIPRREGIVDILLK